jgi:protein SCO1/2
VAPETARSRPWIGVFASLTLVLAVAIAFWIMRKPHHPLPVLSALPPFSLVTKDGEAVTLESLRGRTWVADFIFTRCAGTCPAMTARMAELQKARPGLALVSFTVDPENDTPEVLSRYARAAGALKTWLFVTGRRDAIYALSTQGFKLAAMEVPQGEQKTGDGPFLHSSRLVLVDGLGRIRGYYDSEEAGAIKSLVADLERLEK